MSGHKSWSEISVKVRSDPKRRVRIEQREQAIEAELTISQLREARGATQDNVAEKLNVTQSNVSHFERTRTSSCVLSLIMSKHLVVNWKSGPFSLTRL